MKKLVELSDETYATLQRLATARALSPAEFITQLLNPGPPLPGDDLLRSYLTSAAFPAMADPADRYLALLAWCAHHYPADFADFISHQESGRRYLMLNRDEVNAVRAHNQARQIDGSQFWAVLTIDTPTRRRFVGRLLEYIGSHDETVGQACAALGLVDAAGLHRLSA